MAERRRLDEMLRDALERLLDHYVITGGIDRAIQIALRLFALDFLQEAVHRTLIRLYMYQDRVGSALDQYRRCRDLLDQELGVGPDPQTERLRAELLKLLPGDAADGDGAPARERDDLPERPLLVRAAARRRPDQRFEPTGRPSIAVLSFAGAGKEETWRHLGDGMAEDIATGLGRFRELDVIAPTSALAYRDALVPPERAGAELGTAYVLEGRLRSSGGGLRATVRLVETETARQLWAERCDFAPNAIFSVQDRLACRIVGTLIGQIEQVRLQAAKRRPPADLAAYDLWLRGWSALKRPDLAAIREARRFFQQALAVDPHFARAYVGLAMAHLNEWACFSWNHSFVLHKEALDLGSRARSPRSPRAPHARRRAGVRPGLRGGTPAPAKGAGTQSERRRRARPRIRRHGADRRARARGGRRAKDAAPVAPPPRVVRGLRRDRAVHRVPVRGSHRDHGARTGVALHHTRLHGRLVRASRP